MKKIYLSVYLSVFALLGVNAQRVNVTLEPVTSLNKSEASLQESITDYKVWKNPDLFNVLKNVSTFTIYANDCRS